MEKSKVVFQEGKGKLKSRLVTSLALLGNIEEKGNAPSGVWGSKATVISGGVTIKSSELDLEFDIPFDDNLETNEGEIIVYNLSSKTRAQLKKDAEIRIVAGFGTDTGVIFKGYITKVATARDQSDLITTIKVKDDIQKKETINLSYESGVKASYILKDLIKKTGLPVGWIEIKRDHTYENAVTIDDTLEAALRQYSEVCGVSTFVSNGVLYSCSLDRFIKNGVNFEVSEETGMIGSPQPFTEEKETEDGETVIYEGYEIEMLMQHRMAAGAVVKVNAEILSNGNTVSVKSGRHIFNESEAVTKIKAGRGG